MRALLILIMLNLNACTYISDRTDGGYPTIGNYNELSPYSEGYDS